MKKYNTVWSKIKAKQQSGRGSSLRRTLFVQPLAIIVLSFVAILLVFNLALRYFISEQAAAAIQNQIDVLDNLYVGSTKATQSQVTVFETTYAIVNEDFEIQYTSANLYDFDETEISETIANYFYHNEEPWTHFNEKVDYSEDDDERNDDIEFLMVGNQPEVKIDDLSYVVDVETYSGLLKDYYIKQATTGETGQTYYVFTFANITPVENMDVWINIALTMIFVVIGLGASIFIYLTSRKMDKAFLRLQDYITRVGNREENLSAEPLPYQEFNQVAATVRQMSDMIDANERSQQTFFQNSSHELRTPLMSIQGYAEGIKEGLVKDDKAAARVIYDESQKMAELVDDILTISRLEATQGRLELESVAPAELLYDLSWRLKNKADEKRITFVHDFEDEYFEILADEKMLERALANILSNALRYAKSSINMSLREKDKQLEIVIANDGEAISAEDKMHLFERFYKGSGGHFGIGLAMTKDIIERHGGRILVKSDSEETQFIIYLPIN